MEFTVKCDKGIRNFELKPIHGEVIEVQSGNQISVSSTSGYVDSRAGIYVAPRISSTAKKIDTVFIKTDDGREETMVIVDSKVPLRSGSRVTVVDLVEKKEDGSYHLKVGIVNRDTGSSARTLLMQDTLTSLNMKASNGPSWIAFLTPIVAGYVAAGHWAGAVGGFFVGVAAMWITEVVRGGKIMDTVKDSIDRYLQSLLQESEKPKAQSQAA